jgi:hypothetical protein
MGELVLPRLSPADETKFPRQGGRNSLLLASGCWR